MRPYERSVAVIGSGVAGLTAAHLLPAVRRAPVRGRRPARRPRPHPRRRHDRRQIAGLDSAFLVHNDRTYPTLLRLFAELGVATQESEMSMSVRCDGCGLEYAGSKGLGGLFAHRSNVLPPALSGDAGAGQVLPPTAPGVLRDRDRRPARPAGVPDDRPLHRLLHQPLHVAAGGGGVVVRLRRARGYPPATCSPSWTITACSR